MDRTRQVIYWPKSPGGATEEDFELREAPRREAQSGEVELQVLYLSTDPYLFRMLAGQGKYGGVAPGTPMRGRAVARVLASRATTPAAGQLVLAEWCDWAEHAVVSADAVVALDETLGVPHGAWLGVLGSSGITAWAGLLDVARPQRGETVLVSAATGAVGSVVGQLARLHGCRAVGIAGGAGKTRHLLEDLGFDAAVDYKAPDFADRLAASVPHGIDVYFENVGGAVFDAVLPMLNPYARIPLCGLAALYGTNAAPVSLKNFHCLLDRSVRLQGFKVSDYRPRRQEILGDLARWIRSGELRFHMTILQGLAAAPAALMSLMAGRHLGKQLVQVHAA